jgi:hypothetical protein
MDCHVGDIVLVLLPRLIKMQYMEQSVCGQVTGRFLASRKEGQEGSAEEGQPARKRRGEERLEDTSFVLE